MKSGLRSNLRLRVLLPTAVVALLGAGVGAFAFSGTPGGDAGLEPVQRPAAAGADGAAQAVATRGAWARKANRICARLNREAAALGTPQTRDDLLALLPQSLDLGEAALAELTEVPGPRRDAARRTRMLRAFGRFLALERKAVAALTAGDAEAYARYTGAAFRANDRGNTIARDLGARACAEGGSDDTDLARALERHDVVVAVLYSPDAAVDRLSILEARAGASLAGAGFVAVDVYDAKEIAPVAAEYAVRSAPSVLVLTRDEGAVTAFGGWVDRETVAQAADNASA